MLSDLAARARCGDHEAFAQLAAALAGRMAGIARLILRDEHAAQDAVQDALVAAWRDIRGLRDPERVEAWLRRILVHVCNDRARRIRRRAVHELQGDVVDLHILEPHTDEVPSQRIEERDRLERALARLPAHQRAVLVLTYYLDLSLAESAQTLAIPMGTTKSRLKYARLALRAAIEADERSALLAVGSTA